MWDLILKNGTVFNGRGTPAERIDIATASGVIVAKGRNLPVDQAKHVIDCNKQWVMPGLLDIHTHLDLEVEIEPGLSEVLRHGTTSVLVGNCSLGLAFGTQAKADQNPVVDCFSRVENMPKHVLQKCADNITWDNPRDYLDHFDDLALGPNVAAFVPHSMLRIEVMGIHDAIFGKPTDTQISAMANLLSEAVEDGFMGLSTDGLPYHFISRDPYKDKRIPTQYATNKEIKRLLDVLRRSGHAWQTTPFAENLILTLKRFFLTSGRFYDKPLKVSALAAVDFVLAPRAKDSILALSKWLNSPLVGGQFHFQALASRFRMWGDGIESPMFEEMPSTSRLIAVERDNRQERLRMLNDPVYIRQFKEDWYLGRRGFNRYTLLAKLGIFKYNVIRDLEFYQVDSCPFPAWNGENLKAIFDRLVTFNHGNRSAANSRDETELFLHQFTNVADEADFFVAILKVWDRDFRWWVDMANTNQDKLDEIVKSDYTLPGFNDSGAHLTNMAFYDGNLASLQIAQRESMEQVSRTVSRLTKIPADFFGLDVGTLDLGARADITVINPDKLRHYDTNSGRQLIYRDCFENHQMVNRSDGVVSSVVVGGEVAWDGNKITERVGQKKLGELLRSQKPARMQSQGGVAVM